MKHVEAILVAAMAVSLSGCVLPGKSSANTPPVPVAPRQAPLPTPPPPPPSQLSIPQTQVELPPSQPVSPEAIATTQAPEDVPVVPTPSVRTRPPRPQAPPRTVETATPAAAPPPVATTPPVEETRPNIQEIVSPQEQSRLQGEAAKSIRETQQRLNQIRKRHLNPQEQALQEQILSFLRLSNEAEKQGDMRKAYELAERGLVLAKELSGGR